VQLGLDRIEDIALNALRRAGAAEWQARPVAAATRRAEADGVSSVGLGYLPVYLAHLRSGKLRGDAVPALLEPARPGAVRVDAAHGFAHPAFDAGLDALVQAAHAQGLAGLSLLRSYSIGMLGHPAEDIARRGLIALAFANSPPNMAPWGGRRKLFGTNPLACAVPVAGGAPLVIDQASTVVTKVRLAAKAAAGEPIPPDWAFDADGAPTTDPRAALAGSMAPFGGAKGANIALIVEIFAAALTGGAFSAAVAPYAEAAGAPPDIGQFFLAIDPGAFAPGFADRLAGLVGALREEARAPGDRRLAARDAAARHGVAVDPALIARIENFPEAS
jgi:(2R)-3-sulfolactate dehydrogenase (NADP+)